MIFPPGALTSPMTHYRTNNTTVTIPQCCRLPPSLTLTDFVQSLAFDLVFVNQSHGSSPLLVYWSRSLATGNYSPQNPPVGITPPAQRYTFNVLILNH